jgi:hypothetical protein
MDDWSTINFIEAIWAIYGALLLNTFLIIRRIQLDIMIGTI